MRLYTTHMYVSIDKATLDLFFYSPVRDLTGIIIVKLYDFATQTAHKCSVQTASYGGHYIHIDNCTPTCDCGQSEFKRSRHNF